MMSKHEDGGESFFRQNLPSPQILGAGVNSIKPLHKALNVNIWRSTKTDSKVMKLSLHINLERDSSSNLPYRFVLMQQRCVKHLHHHVWPPMWYIPNPIHSLHGLAFYEKN